MEMEIAHSRGEPEHKGLPANTMSLLLLMMRLSLDNETYISRFQALGPDRSVVYIETARPQGFTSGLHVWACEALVF